MPSIAGDKIRMIVGSVNTFFKYGTQIYDRIQIGLTGDVIERVDVGHITISGTDTKGSPDISGVLTSDVVVASISDLDGTSVTLESAVVDAQLGLTATLSAAPGAGKSVVVDYIVLRMGSV